MTAMHQKKHSAHPLTPGQFCFGFFSVFCLLLILRNSDAAMEYISRGLFLCSKAVIPSLFPFMVLSELILSGDFGMAMIRRIAAPLQRLLRLSDAGCCAFLLGLLCGFPVGAKCIALAYDRGYMTREECERVLCFSNHPSSAFLIGTVGGALWGNRRFGIALYLTVVLSACIIAWLLRPKAPLDPPPCKAMNRMLPASSSMSGAKLFTHSIRSATESMLLVCAYVVFFSALTGTLSLILKQWNVSAPIQASLTAIFELSSGMSFAVALKPLKLAALLCAFAAGWSGLSVHCQILSVCDGRGFSFRPYLIAKCVQAVLCVCLFALLLLLFPDLTLAGEACLH